MASGSLGNSSPLGSHSSKEHARASAVAPSDAGGRLPGLQAPTRTTPARARVRQNEISSSACKDRLPVRNQGIPRAAKDLMFKAMPNVQIPLSFFWVAALAYASAVGLSGGAD